MAARSSFSSQHILSPGVHRVVGRCVGAAAANPTGLKGNGIASIAYVSTGKYTITLSDKWAGLVTADFSVIDSTGLKHFLVTPSAETVASSKTISISVSSAAFGSAPALADLASTETLLIELVLSNSSSNPKPY